MKLFLIFIILFCSVAAFGQEKKYFSDSLIYKYSAYYIDSKNDTLSTEIIKIVPTDSIFNFNQTLLKYHYTNSNSELKPYVDSITGINDKWVDSIGEGAIENKNGLWIHPIRSNQYVLTEIAPFPQIVLPPSLKIKWKSVLTLPKEWGNFSGEVRSKYEIVAIVPKVTIANEKIQCWKVECVGKHNRLGKSYLTLYFNLDIGFVEMEYRFFNNDKILFKLIEITHTLPNKS